MRSLFFASLSVAICSILATSCGGRHITNVSSNWDPSEFVVTSPQQAALLNPDIRIVFPDLDNAEWTNADFFKPPSVFPGTLMVPATNEALLGSYGAFMPGTPGVFRVEIYHPAREKPFHGTIVFGHVPPSASAAERRVWRVGIEPIRFEQATGGLVAASYQPIAYSGKHPDVVSNYHSEYSYDPYDGSIVGETIYGSYYYDTTMNCASWFLWLSDMQLQ